MALPLVRRGVGGNNGRSLPSADDIQKLLQTVTNPDVMKEAVVLYKELFAKRREDVFVKVGNLLEDYAQRLMLARSDTRSPWAGDMPRTPAANILEEVARQALVVMGPESTHLNYHYRVTDDSQVLRSYTASQCGLMTASRDPMMLPSTELKAELQGKDAIIAFQDNLFYATQPMNDSDAITITKISTNQENKANITRLKGMITEDYHLASQEGLKLIGAVVGGLKGGKALDSERMTAMDKGFNAWLSAQNKTMKNGIVYEATKTGEIQTDTNGKPLKVEPDVLRTLIADSKDGYAAYVNKTSTTLVLRSEEVAPPETSPRETARVQA